MAIPFCIAVEFGPKAWLKVENDSQVLAVKPLTTILAACVCAFVSHEKKDKLIAFWRKTKNGENF